MRKKMGKRLFLTFVVILVFSASAWAQNQPEPRLITVTGDAEVKVEPDEIVINIGVSTVDIDLKIAKSQNDTVIKKVMTIIKEYKIDPKYVQTSYINIRPQYEYPRAKRNFIGYSVTNNITIILKETVKFEGFLSSVLEAGINNVYGIDFRNTELRKYRDQARAIAIRAAQEKAAALAKELNQKIGRTYSIREGPIWYDRWEIRNAAIQRALEMGLTSEAESTFALGQINIKANVTVSFELE